jgi:hypothetical protein
VGISNKLLALLLLLFLLLLFLLILFLLTFLLLDSAHCGHLCGAKFAGQLSFYAVKMCCWIKAVGFNAEIVNMPTPHI